MFAKSTKELTLPVKYSELSQRERAIVRLKYIEKQNGNCRYCNNPLTDEPSKEVCSKKINVKLFPFSFFEYPVHLHHNHDTDLTIGAVHARCNAVLWEHEGE